MNKHSYYRKILTSLSVFLAIFLLASCRVTLVAPYEEEALQQIQQVAKEVDLFYLKMKEEAATTSFADYSERYAELEAEINAMVMRNRIRPLNEHSTRIGEIIQKRWARYREEHRTKDQIPTALIEFNRMAISDLFYAMLVAEKGKSIAE
jgi:hypothetical protein